MRRNFLRPILDFPEPFLFHRVFIHPMPMRFTRLPEIEIQESTNNSDDPHQIFSQFFDKHGIKTQAEKQFFKKHYPQKVEPQKIDPYKVLELQNNATQEQIQEAYRKLALKYHTKNNQAPDAAEKFKQVSKAYQQLTTQKKSRDLGELSSSSFFEDFDKQINDFFKPFQKEAENKQKKTQKADNEYYLQTSYYERGDGKKAKVIVQKNYEKDGKKLKVRRQENIKEDGTKQITQTIDDGKQIKKKVFNDGKQQKKAIA